jgi:hypothetical protein
MSASFDLRGFDPDKAGLNCVNFHGSLCDGWLETQVKRPDNRRLARQGTKNPRDHDGLTSGRLNFAIQEPRALVVRPATAQTSPIASRLRLSDSSA